MQLLIIFLALLSSMASALPAINTARDASPVPADVPAPVYGDGRGATLFAEQNFKGTSGAIPANSWCTDLNNVFFDLDGKARSLIVEKGKFCTFYVNYGCPARGKAWGLEMEDYRMEASWLQPWLDRKIHSVYCYTI